MSATLKEANLLSVEDAERGEAIRRRRMALGIRSVRELAMRTGVARSAASGAEHGDASRGTFERLERWLADREAEENGGAVVVRPVGDPQEHLMEVEVQGRGGFRMFVRGPVDNPEALADMAERLIRKMSTPPDDSEPVD